MASTFPTHSSQSQSPWDATDPVRSANTTADWSYVLLSVLAPFGCAFVAMVVLGIIQSFSSSENKERNVTYNFNLSPNSTAHFHSQPSGMLTSAATDLAQKSVGVSNDNEQSIQEPNENNSGLTDSSQSQSQDQVSTAEGPGGDSIGHSNSNLSYFHQNSEVNDGTFSDND